MSSSGVLCQSQKDPLGDVLGKVRIADHSQGGEINEVHMPARHLGKRRLRPAAGVISQKLLIGQTVHSRNNSRRP